MVQLLLASVLDGVIYELQLHLALLEEVS